MHKHASKIKLRDKETVAICIQASVTCYLHVIHRYSCMVCTIRIWYRKTRSKLTEGQKDKEKGKGFSRFSLQYQAITNRNIYTATLLEQCSVLVEKEQWGDFLHARLVIVSA